MIGMRRPTSNGLPGSAHDSIYKTITLKGFQEAHRGLGNKRVDFEPLEKQRDFHVTLLQFEKNEQILHHDHPEMTGVILCASGEIEAWIMTCLGNDPTKSTFF